MSEPDNSIAGERDRALRRAFATHLPEMIPGTPDLTLALLDALEERKTELSVMQGVKDFKSIEFEIAFSIFRNLFTERNDTRAEMDLQYAILAALIDPESTWQLKLTYGRRGRPKSAFSDIDRWALERTIQSFIAEAVERGVKLESVITDAAQKFGMSRSKAFGIWQRRGSDEKRGAALEATLALYEPKGPPINNAEPAKFKGWMRRFFDYFTQEF